MEDLFLENSELLLRYVSQVRGSWDPIWGDFPPELDEDLLRSVGDGLISFLWTDRSRRLVTKSPSVRNVGRFHQLFPKAKLLILIRDGRSIVQSCIDTFGWDFDTATHRFSVAARELLTYMEAERASAERYLVVRYEDLVTDMRTTMTGVLDFAGLSRDGFDFSAAEDLPVRGSSSHMGPGRTSVHWEPVAKSASFRPLQRWESWDEDRRARFEWLAGREARALGYEVDGSQPQPTLHRLRDLSWQGKRWTRRFLYRLRGRLGPATRPLRDRIRVLVRGGDG